MLRSDTKAIAHLLSLGPLKVTYGRGYQSKGVVGQRSHTSREVECGARMV